MIEKACTKCGVIKPLKNFVKKLVNRSGYGAICKKCDAIRGNTYRGNNKDKIAESNKQYRANNKDKITENEKQYKANNKEKIAESDKQYKANNKDKIRESSRRRRAKKIAVEENYTKSDEAITYMIFNYQCFYCNINKNLTIDHHYCLNDYNPLTLENAVVLCRSCNSSKGIKKPSEFYSMPQLKTLSLLFKKASETILL